MTKILVGCTGLVGGNLISQTDFDFKFNSKNIHELPDLVSDGCEIYLACLPATKWQINKDAESRLNDLQNCLDLINILSKRKYSKVFLLSTIDVYSGVNTVANESMTMFPTGIGYGENRRLFEFMVKESLSYEKLKIYRLPALFGEGLKKNILFDLINKNQLEKINKNSYYQWYNLRSLWQDISSDTYPNEIVNLFTEPVFTGDIIDRYFPGEDIGFYSEEPIVYNHKTNLSTDGYINSAEEMLTQIGEFLDENRNKQP